MRDLIGYGRDVPRVEWPGGARLALSIVVNYEEGGEKSHFLGDENERLGEVRRPVDPTYRDLATESVYEYGSRAGIHRILRVLAERQVKCTIFASAVALELNDEVALALRESEHEVCGHGWQWSEDWLVSREEERERIRRAINSIERMIGRRPVGWYNRWMPSVHTRELLVEEGGFLYDSNAYNDDLPYYVDVHGTDHLVIPYTLTYNDIRYPSGHFGAPQDFLDYCRRGLSYLLEEGATFPRMMSVGIHARLTGQAARASVLREFLEYALSMESVWIARRRDIAEWWIEHYPPQ